MDIYTAIGPGFQNFFKFRKTGCEWVHKYTRRVWKVKIRRQVNKYLHTIFIIYNYIIFQHSSHVLQYTCSSVPEASGCPQKKMSLAEQQATHALLSSLLRLR